MAHPPSKSRNLKKKEPRSLNLIPIMNLFIVVIPMLMTVMVSVHLAMIQITLPTVGDEAQVNENEEPPPRIILVLQTTGFEIVVGEDVEEEIGLLEAEEQFGNFDYESLNNRMKSLKEQYEKQYTVDILPDPSVKYDTLLKSIDICKFNGFQNIKYLTSSRKIYRASKK
ncbi:MAG: biopolymer transporter ExbD [Candidatus Cloacimonetes bacterium]|nr:biopolymer transporter ExbD [Candidatus Cloacimonadota bacterium]